MAMRWQEIVVIPEVEERAQSLAEFRGRHRYNHLDDNLRAMYADVPVLAQWDDHETTNNWYPGEILTDERYDVERRVVGFEAEAAAVLVDQVLRRGDAGAGEDGAELGEDAALGDREDDRVGLGVLPAGAKGGGK